MSLDISIIGAKVIDGTGNPWFKADIGIRDGHIVEIRNGGLTEAGRKIDGHRLAVCPGFIDLHCHSDMSILPNNRAESRSVQGITTDVTGNCGSAPHTFAPEFKDEMSGRLSRWAKRKVEVDWTTLEGWRKKLEEVGIGVNIAPFCGFGTIRASVMGKEGEGGERHEPTSEELGRMRDLVMQAMEQGAFGMTTGLEYAPQWNAYTEEIIELCNVVARYGGLYMSHLRSEDFYFLDAVKEFVRICGETGLSGCISHFKVCCREHWGESVEALHLIEEARADGVDIIYDLYPWLYPAVSDVGRFLIAPEEDIEELKGEVMRKLRDPEAWGKLKEESAERLREQYWKNEERRKALAERGMPGGAVWDPLTFWPIVHSSHLELMGRKFAEAAQLLGFPDPWEAIRAIYLDDQGETRAASGHMCEEDLVRLLTAPFSAISTDASASDEPMALHPRDYGTYPKVLGYYVRERRILRLEDAIRRATSLPAQFLGLLDRGLIKKGFWADIVVFDPETIANKATYAEPCRYPEGIPYVLVNGVLVIDEEKHTGALPGRALKHTL